MHAAPSRSAAAIAFLAVVLAGTADNLAQTSFTAATARTFTDPRLNMTVVATEIQLPLGRWQVEGLTPAAPIDQVFLVGHFQPEDVLGRRSMLAQTERQVQGVQWRIQSLFPAITQYASTHGGVGPSTFTDLDRRRFGPLIDEATRSPWPEDATRPAASPYLFLVPATPIAVTAPATPQAPPRPAVARAARTPLAFELRPYADDGKHWVLFSDGSMEYVAIDKALLAKHKVALNPVRRAGAEPATATRRYVPYTMLALLRDANTPTASITLTDEFSTERREIQWTLRGGKADPALLSEWAEARAQTWMPLAAQTHAPILQAWLDRSSAIYGPPTGAMGQGAMPAMSPNAMRDRNRSTSAFDILGGRAAVRETLQMELIRARAGAPAGSSAATVPVTSLKGVDVAALPFDRMLAGRPGGRLALADLVPEDRLFVYFAKPSAVFPFLTHGADMIGRAGSTMTSSAFDDNLKTRYLRRLGLPEDGSRRLLESGVVTELAMVAPDLFFIDGTDLTLLMRLRSPDTSVAALGVLAGVDLSTTAIVEKKTATGRSAFWARQGDVLLVSTNRREIDHVQQIGKTGAGSLGRSAELRYMLAELPLRAETRALVYLSDPFIRRMVGPAVKIGQLRRMRAAAEMSMVTAGALLYKLDGHRDPPNLPNLIALGYVARSIAAADYRLESDYAVTSAKWGSLAELQSLESAPIDAVTADEAAAYKSYVDEYRQYWRQYFDPIGFRLDDAPDGALELSTFILPLIDSQLYNQLRGVLETREKNTPFRVPVVAPEPVFQMSLNLSDSSWVGISSGWGDFFSQYTGISPEMFDLLGPGLHIAVQDADPVISLGTADLFGAFGASTFGARFDMAIPFALSLLTRPCKIFIELQDPARALTLMRRAASTSDDRRGMNVSFRQIEGRDAWIYTLGIPGMATLRLGLEIQNGYLVFSNMPWSGAVTVSRVETRGLNGGAIRVAPDAVRQGLASLFATQAEQDQTAALASMAALLPMLQTLAATPEDAASRYAALFGTTPLHPGKGNFVWANGTLASTQFGSPTQWKAPQFKPELGNFGLFDGATILDLSMQLEQGGLRAVARWVWK